MFELSSKPRLMYFDELERSMRWLADQKDTVFLGQAVEVPGTAMFKTLAGINSSQKIEMPVAEEMQMLEHHGKLCRNVTGSHRWIQRK